MEPINLFFLLIFAFIAGFIDAIVGGGGLIQLPAMFNFMPQLPIATALGTNKFAAFAGTMISAYRYIKLAKVKWNVIIPASITALIFSFTGAACISYFNKDLVKPLVLVLLIGVAIYTFLVKNLGLHAQEKYLSKTQLVVYSLVTGMVIGFYDGFFGPGTGSFLIMVYVTVFGFDFLNASVSAKIINCVTNIAALSFFIWQDKIDYAIAVPVAISNMGGSWIGAKMAIKKGSGFVRSLYLVMVTAMIIKFGYDLLIVHH